MRAFEFISRLPILAIATAVAFVPGLSRAVPTFEVEVDLRDFQSNVITADSTVYRRVKTDGSGQEWQTTPPTGNGPPQSVVITGPTYVLAASATSIFGSGGLELGAYAEAKIWSLEHASSGDATDHWAIGRATFSDDVTLTVPAGFSGPALLSLRFQVSGEVCIYCGLTGDIVVGADYITASPVGTISSTIDGSYRWMTMGDDGSYTGGDGAAVSTASINSAPVEYVAANMQSVPINTPFSMKINLYAQAYLAYDPSTAEDPSSGETFSSSRGMADFSNTAVLSSVSIYDSGGNPIAGAALWSSDGQPFQTVPEPSAWLLSWTALAGLAFSRRRSRRTR